MVSTKAEFVPSAEGSQATVVLTSSDGIPSSDVAARPDAQTRRSSRGFGRASNFLSNTLLRPRGKSFSNPSAGGNDWGRPVGGSEGPGIIYNPTMETRERTQVLRSVATLTKTSDNDMMGAAAEAFSGNATPSVLPRSRFFANFRTTSSPCVTEEPPSYQQTSPEPPRRGSEGSVIPHIDLTRSQETQVSATSSSSTQRTSSQSRSYFSTEASNSAFGSAASSGSTSVPTSPGQESSAGQSKPRQPRRGSIQFGAAARQAFRSSRSFLGLANDMTEEPAVENMTRPMDGGEGGDNGMTMTRDAGVTQQTDASIVISEPKPSSAAPDMDSINGHHHQTKFVEPEFSGLMGSTAKATATATATADANNAGAVSAGGGTDSQLSAAVGHEARPCASVGSNGQEVGLASNASLSTGGSRPIGLANPTKCSGRRSSGGSGASSAAVTAATQGNPASDSWVFKSEKFQEIAAASRAEPNEQQQQQQQQHLHLHLGAGSHAETAGAVSAALSASASHRPSSCDDAATDAAVIDASPSHIQPQSQRSLSHLSSSLDAAAAPAAPSAQSLSRVVQGCSTAPSTPSSPAVTSIAAPPSISAHPAPAPSTPLPHPHHPSYAGVASGSVFFLSPSSFSSFDCNTPPVTTTTTTTGNTTAATTPSQSTCKLAQVQTPSSLSRIVSTAATSSASAPTSAQHASLDLILGLGNTTNDRSSQVEASPLHSNASTELNDPACSSSARQSILQSPQSQPQRSSLSVGFASSSSSVEPSLDSYRRSSLPLTPPSSIGPCPSPRSSISVASPPRFGVDGPSVAASNHPARHDLPSPPASTAYSSISTPSSRRGSSNDFSGAPASAKPSYATSSGNEARPFPSSRTGRVSFDLRRSLDIRRSVQPDDSALFPRNNARRSLDLRRFSLFGTPSSANKMPSTTARAPSAPVANGVDADPMSSTNGILQSSSSTASTSKFFSRISLPGSRRASAVNESPLSSPETNTRLRFASLGKLGRGGKQRSSASATNGLRNSMQSWASASTDVLGLGPGSSEGRNSLALAREEATRFRKSLHLPRGDLIDLSVDDAPMTASPINTSAHTQEERTLPPIATATVLKPQEKPVSPNLNNARRPSFNFLRRGSSNSTNSAVNTDGVNGERRGSRGSLNFARNLMNRTLSRNSNKASETPPETASPVFRNGIFDNEPSNSATNVMYPGLSSTVNWGAPANPRPAPAEVAPGEVDPTAAIPAYPGSAANSATVQPKAVAALSGGVLATRRPSQGIDQEQDTAEAVDTVPESLTSRVATASTPSQSTESNASRARPTRSRNALSHLPRLNSMRAISKPGAADSSSSAANGIRDQRHGSTSTTGETSEEEQELSEDEDDADADMTGQISDYQELDTETDDETDDDPSPTVSRRTSAAPMSATGSSGGLNRNRPTESLVLPPAPSFIPHTNNTALSRSANTSTSTLGATAASNGDPAHAVGRDSWTSFNVTGFTPFETPTPSFGGSAYNAFAGPTPRARQELSESSYFAARPGTSNSHRATTAGTMSGEAPPPSPSIISRSRAPSSASMRTLRTPGPGMPSGPVPNRSMPAPVGALPNLALARQISTASSTRVNPTERSKSPAIARASSPRPSISGTLTPNTAVGEGSASREPSIERPASERPASNQDVEAKSTNKAVVIRPLVGLEGMSSSAPRPNFYQQKSKSLVDLLGPSSRRLKIDSATAQRSALKEPSGVDQLRTPTSPRPSTEAPAYSKKDILAPINVELTAPASIASPGVASLGRRRSMFEMRAEPPPYSIIHNRPEGPQIILPREEEGREKLPTYCCGVHIEGYLPRKMEFSAPGVQAKDRSWKRQYFVLHGTSLRVYKSDLSVEKHAVNGNWGEMKGVHVHLEPMNEDGSGSGSSLGLGAAAREAIAHTSLGHRNDTVKAKDGAYSFDVKNGLIRNYTLQGAESGLAADYLKRRHVVRVRAEGEQFLLQTRSDRHVVDWIEALQAATNVAMDLEKRPMPKFITLPRRRRRRRRQPDGTTLTAAEQEARDLAEAQRRSMAEASGQSAGASTGAPTGTEATPRMSMSQWPSMSIENELNPSAAFEEMLREDQEDLGRRGASVM